MNIFSLPSPSSIATFSDRQSRALSAVPRIVGSLSFLSSSFVIFTILSHRRKFWKNTYDRIILALSICDALSSLGFVVFGAWAIPEEVPFVPRARARNFVACEIGGCLLHMIIGSCLYTAGLMIYFILLVRWEWPPSRIATRVEPWIHGIVLVCTLATMVAALVLDYFNPFPALPGLCFVIPFPPDCADDSSGNSIPCLRGKGARSFAWGIASLPFVTILMVSAAMVLLVLKVRATELRLRQYQVGPPSNAWSLTRRTALRGVAYVVAFLVSLVPPSLILYISMEYRPNQSSVWFTMWLLVASFFPMQGIFNAIIYTQPKWKELTQNWKWLEWLRGSDKHSSSSSQQRSTYSRNNTTMGGVVDHASTRTTTGRETKEHIAGCPGEVKVNETIHYDTSNDVSEAKSDQEGTMEVMEEKLKQEEIIPTVFEDETITDTAVAS